MNGFSLLSESYRIAAERGEIEKELAQKKCRIFDFLATCDQKDFCIMYDSTAFNDIMRAYVRLAVERLVDNGAIDEEQGEYVRDTVRLLLSEKTAEEVLKLTGMM